MKDYIARQCEHWTLEFILQSVAITMALVATAPWITVRGIF